MPNKKILQINTSQTGMEGITMVILNYIGNMDKAGLQIDYLAVNHVADAFIPHIEEAGMKLYELPFRQKHPIKYVFALARLIRNNAYDIVHIHCNSCTATLDLMGAWLGGASVRIAHCHNTTCDHLLAHETFRPLFDMLYNKAFACGDLAGKWLFQGKPFLVLNNATNPIKFRFNSIIRDEMRKRLGLDGHFSIGHVGVFNEQKNHQFLIDIFADVVKRDERYRLFLIGDGVLKTEMEKRVENLGLKDYVVFVGFTNEIPAYLNAMDLMLLPSLYEGLPNVVVEWQIAGLPAIVSDTVTTQCKMTPTVSFSPLDKDSWVDAILSTKPIEDREKQSMENINLITRAGFNIKSEAVKLRKIYLS